MKWRLPRPSAMHRRYCTLAPDIESRVVALVRIIAGVLAEVPRIIAVAGVSTEVIAISAIGAIRLVERTVSAVVGHPAGALRSDCGGSREAGRQLHRLGGLAGHDERCQDDYCCSNERKCSPKHDPPPSSVDTSSNSNSLPSHASASNCESHLARVGFGV